MGIFFWVAKISNIFLGCLKFLIFFGVMGRCGPEPTYEEKNESTPLPGAQTRLHSDVLFF